MKLKATFLFFSIFPLVSNASVPPSLSAMAFLYQDNSSKVVNVFHGTNKISFSTDKDVLKEALEEKDIKPASDEVLEPDINTTLNQKTDVYIKKMLPVTVFDEEKVIIGRSAHLGAQEILKDLSINLYASDEVKVADPLDEIVVGLKIYIDRANTVNLYVDGGLRKIHTRLGTVSDLLYAENIILNPQDRVEPSLDTKIADNMDVKVIRVIQNENSELVDIPFAVEVKKDSSLLEGEIKTERTGEIGKKEVYLKRTMENGAEIAREVLSEKIIKEPVSQVVIRGTKPRFSYASGSFADLINDAAAKYGVDASKMQRLMMCESGGNPNSVGGGGRFFGLFQYLPSTWSSASSGAGYAGASIFDAEAQIYTTAWKISRSGYGAWPICGRR